MTKMQELSNRIIGAGWFGGTLKMTITIENEFEGFYGRASETWESRINITINGVKENGKIVIPDLSVTGDRHDNLEIVAEKVLNILKP